MTNNILFKTKEMYNQLELMTRKLTTYDSIAIKSEFKNIYIVVGGKIKSLHEFAKSITIFGNIGDYELENILTISNIDGDIIRTVEDIIMGYYSSLCGGKDHREYTYIPDLINAINEI